MKQGQEDIRNKMKQGQKDLKKLLIESIAQLKTPYSDANSLPPEESTSEIPTMTLQQQPPYRSPPIYMYPWRIKPYLSRFDGWNEKSLCGLVKQGIRVF